MANKLTKAKNKASSEHTADSNEATEPGQYIRHQTPESASVWESKGYESAKDLAQVNGRLTLVVLGMKDLKIWLREIESFLNFDARFGGRDTLLERIDNMERKLDEYCAKLDEALQEEDD